MRNDDQDTRKKKECAEELLNGHIVPTWEEIYGYLDKRSQIKCRLYEFDDKAVICMKI